ncbi:DUF5693 family protein [uncultured Megasphaera sp.]|uniref:DUF5693 family protein n=1 Tax=uncultured Megasphaera sp. TaxID=165188 RepID=UPI00265A3D17|nr:DUF5693 family protein [uncultured Megasphaera sp.]
MVKQSMSKMAMIAAVCIGLLCAVYLCVQRHDVEERSMTIEQAMDYDAVVTMARNDGYDLDTAMEKCRQAGVTSFTIYDTTLNKLTQRGEFSLITRLGSQLYYRQFQIEDLTYDYYLIGKPLQQQDAYFDEVAADLKVRLGAQNVARLANSQYRILGIRGVMPALGEVNLGILSADAKQIAAHGFHVILRPSNYSDPSREQVAHFFQRADAIPNASGIMFVGKEVLGYSPVAGERKTMLEFTADQMKQRHLPFYMIEAVNQLQYNQQDGMYDLAGLLDYDTVRVYAMAKEELEKITPEEASMRYYISDLERNARVNLFALYKKPLHGMNLTETNLSYVAMTSQKLKDRGYTLGRASVMEAYYPNRLLLAVTAAAAACGFLFVLNLLLPLPERINRILLVLAVIVGAGGALIAKGALFLQVMAIGCAVLAPTAAMLLLLDYWKKKGLQKRLGYAAVVRDGTIGLVCAFAVSLIGGLYIAAMLGNIRFLMEFDFYRGVKLTFVLPLILVAIGYLQRFPLWGQTIASPQEFTSFVKSFLNIPIKMGTLLLLGFLGFVAFIFVGRSGHTAGVPVPGFEVALRRFLETVMYARPREKEFLVGHPAFFLMVAALYRKWPQLLHFFLVLAASIGIGSMVETFAHIRTPFLMSLVRGIDGLAMGIILGCAGIVVLAVLNYVTAWLGKQVNGRD